MATPRVDRRQLDPLAFRNTYIEDGALLTLAVNTDAARRRERSPYVPLGIFIANNGRGPITIDRESFSLADDTGHRYPLASVEETRSIGARMTLDLRVSGNFFDIISRRVLGRPRVAAVFFPIPVSDPGMRSRGIVLDTIEMQRSAWLVDVVYFPHPEGVLLNRVYELRLKPREFEDPIFVRFAVE